MRIDCVERVTFMSLERRGAEADRLECPGETEFSIGEGSKLLEEGGRHV